MRIVLDENVSLDLAERLRGRGHEVTAVAELDARGASDEAIWAMARDAKALLITRDYHFTDRIRFNPGDSLGILFIRHGNLTSADEVSLVMRFLGVHDTHEYEGHLLTLSRGGSRIR